MPGFFTRGGGRYARPPSRIEEVFYPAVLADPNVDADGLTDLLREGLVLAEPPEAVARALADLSAAPERAAALG
ncbi:MAG: hypothetical protein ACRDQF_11740, partial [Thermocrispum sp.]